MLLGCYVLNDAREVIFGDSLDDFFDEWVLVLSEILIFDLVVEFLTTCFSNEKSFGCSSNLESHLGSILKLTNEQILLDGSFGSCVPVDVS